ncbi:hypothetical protein [Clostridium sp. DJ247]|uniref:hypothetical protein n=1 Tax=Clostridium sp. DJ247 TaxID=2726188 RepID=UPI00162725BA|nr:hypothetical protein [Clostridium sp. DJ247]MBC2579863.1 hypothetical protein [Clostridium sp. DJ247]
MSDKKKKSRVISYNLPSYGNVSCYLFPITEQVYDLLDNYSHITRLRNISQLGTIKYIFPGAHHTRYEYVFMQLMLISNIKIAKNQTEIKYDISLGSSLSGFGELSGKEPTGAEILQVLSIISNIGHQEDTFTSSKVILHFLNKGKSKDKDCYNFYKAFRRGLPKESQKLFEDMINQKNYFKVHYFIALFLLERYKGYSKKNLELSILCSNILIKYLDKENCTSESFGRLWKLFSAIRRLAYLSLDMNYTPVSISMNTSNIIMNSANFIDDVLDDQSALNKMLEQLDSIINTQIYNSAKSLLNSACIAKDIEKSINIVDLRKIDDLVNCFKPSIKVECNGYSFCKDPMTQKIENNWIESTEIVVTYPILENIKEDIYQIEKRKQEKLGVESCHVAVQCSSKFREIHIAYAINKGKKDNVVAIAQKIIRDIANCTDVHTNENVKRSLVEYILKSVFSFDENYYNITPLRQLNFMKSVFIGKGAKNIADKIDKATCNLDSIDKDKKHEIITTSNVLRSIDYSGLIICFVGDVKIVPKNNNGKPVDEIDGLIYFPNKNSSEGLCVLVEAKNYSHGSTDAKKQLEDTKKFIYEKLEGEIKEVNRGAYMVLKLK